MTLNSPKIKQEIQSYRLNNVNKENMGKLLRVEKDKERER